MALTLYRQADANPSILQGRRAAIIGYGNQGRAHALNLRDSGVEVVVGQRLGSGAERAAADGFDALAVREAAGVADLIVMTLPDESAAEVFDKQIAPVLRPHSVLGFVHGFNIHYRFIRPPLDVDVVMIAPKGPGTLLRSLYLEGRGLPALMAVHQDSTGSAKAFALAWSWGIGSTRACVVETTFACETETDLFGEQAVLCGGVSALTKAAFETMVATGYDPVFAYLECVHELKQVVDLLYAHGLSGMRRRISNTAEYGDLTRGPRLMTDTTRQELKRILNEVRSGAFAREWMEESHTGGRRFRELHAADEDTLFEQAGAEVRSWMPWLVQT